MPKVKSTNQKLDEAIDAASAALPIEGKARLILIADFESVMDRGDIERIIDEAKGYGSVRKAVYYANAPVREELG